MDEFIELNRTFYELSDDYGHAAKSDDIDVSEALGLRIGNDLTWSDLLKQHRVILLAEAGAGKTREIRYATQKLRTEDKKKAFFLRLEHIVADFETAFEEGNYQELQEWLASNEEGWILLDSVDEARLKDPKDFENAIRKLAHVISSASARTYIVITSRVTAWRSKTDLAVCNKYFPPVPEALNEEEHIGEDDDEFPIDKKVSPKGKKSAGKTESVGFRIYTLTNLSGEQISKFAQERGINDHRKFLEEIDRQDASAFTTRPQDLEEIVDFWNDQGKIGTRFELMKHSVERRLKERDQDRADAKPLNLKKIREGARLLAAACTLTHQSTINILDGTHSPKGLDVRSILLDWNDHDLQILLNRPIFDEAIYGSVRFHHRSVREYLTAEWFCELLKNDGSRQRIENMFFRDQYGMKVVLPSMKPVLSWLVLFDSIIMEKIYFLEPEIILEGGDPNMLPLEKRKEILWAICEKISLGTASRSVEDRAAVQRFASADMADDIKQLILKHQDNNVLSYLMRMIWQGRIKEALPAAKSFAENEDVQKYTRIAAIRAVKEVGTEQDFDDILKNFILETENQHDRRIVAELIDNISSDEKSADWILKVLENIQDKEKYNIDGLPISLANFIERADINAVSKILKGIDKFLKKEPFIERRCCEISEQYGWLLPISLRAAERLISHKHRDALSCESLYILSQAFAFNEYEYNAESKLIKNDLSKIVPAWKELNHSLFWYDVEETRRMWEEKRQDSLEYERQVSIFGHFWSFSEDDFDLIIQDILARPSLADRLIALSLAFQLYRDNKRPKSWLSKLKNAVTDNETLEQRLNFFLHPSVQSPEIKELNKRHANWKRRNKQQEKKRQENHKKWLEWLADNYQELRNNRLEKGVVSHPQYYMHQKMHEKSDKSLTTKWTVGDWESLIEIYGFDAAQAFRDGMVSFWRGYVPKLRSEQDEKDTTEFAIIFGLSGLAVEAAETSNWPETINEEEAELACKYALHELNGFPSWFPHLYEKFPDIINRVLLNEIEWEFQSQETKHYILSQVCWHCRWLWDGLAPTLLDKLKNSSCNEETLDRMLNIIQGSSSISNSELAVVATDKCCTINSLDNLSYWFAVWIGTDPEIAINHFSLYLEDLRKQDLPEAKNQAMQVIVNLVGERQTASNARENFKTPQHLKDLYMLMHKYIRVEEDIQRAGKGAYSPGLRDDAQHARSRLFSILIEIPGKESYLAMRELSEVHPVEHHRIWMAHNAKKRAELDADLPPWESEKFCEFNKVLESSPTNHRELFDLGVQRILDLKHDLEDGDTSNAPILIDVKEETKIRNYIGGWCRDRAKGRYSVPQEEEFSDSKRSDIRFLGAGFDCAIPVELKLADNNWSGSKLYERLENQLCGDYMRDNRSSFGIFLLIYRGEKKSWELPNGAIMHDFSKLIEALQSHWDSISNQYPKVEQIEVIGIDLTKRSQSKK